MRSSRTQILAVVALGVSAAIAGLFLYSLILPAPADGRYEVLTFEPGEDGLSSVVFDSVAGFAYFGTCGDQGRIVRVDLSTFQRVDALVLEAGEDCLRAAVLEPASRTAYFGTSNGPGRVVKIDLETFERVEAITFEPGEGPLVSAVFHPESGLAYFGTSTTPGRIVELDLATFRRVDAITLPSVEGGLYSAVIDPDADLAYFGTFTGPTKVVKVALAPFQRVGAVTLESDWPAKTSCRGGEGQLFTGVIDPIEDIAYFGTLNHPGCVVRIDLGTFLRADAIQFEDYEFELRSSVIDPVEGFAYFGAIQTGVVVVDLTSFERVEVIEVKVGGPDGAAFIDPGAGFAYFGVRSADGPAHVVKLPLRVSRDRPVADLVGVATVPLGELVAPSSQDVGPELVGVPASGRQWPSVGQVPVHFARAC